MPEVTITPGNSVRIDTITVRAVAAPTDEAGRIASNAGYLSTLDDLRAASEANILRSLSAAQSATDPQEIVRTTESLLLEHEALREAEIIVRAIKPLIDSAAREIREAGRGEGEAIRHALRTASTALSDSIAAIARRHTPLEDRVGGPLIPGLGTLRPEASPEPEEQAAEERVHACRQRSCSP